MYCICFCQIYENALSACCVLRVPTTLLLGGAMKAVQLRADEITFAESI